VREVDLVGQLGGEVFAILLPVVARALAIVTTQRWCQSIARMG